MQNLSASPIDAIRRPAMTTLSLVAFAQMTPLRDALSVASVETMAELIIELKRLAAGLLAVKSAGVSLEYARIMDVSGAGLLAGNCMGVSHNKGYLILGSL